jgi:hypothetical protein
LGVERASAHLGRRLVDLHPVVLLLLLLHHLVDARKGGL